MNKEDTLKGSQEVVHTTIGDLVEAITQIALEAGKTEEEGYRLASATIESILRRHGKRGAYQYN